MSIVLGFSTIAGVLSLFVRPTDMTDKASMINSQNNNARINGDDLDEFYNPAGTTELQTKPVSQFKNEIK